MPSSRSSSASTGSTARASGSGLGLAIARELAEVMDGRIELDSRNGWTLFTLVLRADVPDRDLAADLV
jgi:signal transduction histidine kinase